MVSSVSLVRYGYVPVRSPSVVCAQTGAMKENVSAISNMAMAHLRAKHPSAPSQLDPSTRYAVFELEAGAALAAAAFALRFLMNMKAAPPATTITSKPTMATGKPGDWTAIVIL